MAVRAFNGSGDLINTATGALANGTFGTQAVIVKRGTTGAWHTFLAMHTSGGAAHNQFAYRNDNTVVWWIDGTTIGGPAAIATTAWGLIVARKASGTATPRFSLYDFTAETWSHADGDGTRPNWSTPGSGTVRVEWQGFDRLNGRLAVRAAWNSLPWSADTTGDAAIEAAGLETSAANWLDASPDAMWLFNQAAVTTDVEDVTGNGADQTSRSGTTVITDDDPPGFDFSLEAGETVTLSGALPALTGSFAADASADAELSGVLPALTGAFGVDVSADASLTGALPAVVGGFDIDAAADVALAGQLPALAGDFSVTSQADAALSGTLPAITGSFTTASTADATLVGALPALTGSFQIVEADLNTVTLDGALPALTGSFDVDAAAQAALAGTLPTVTGAFAIATEITSVTLTGLLPLLDGALTVDVSADVELAGTLPVLAAAFQLGTSATVVLDGTLPVLQGGIINPAESIVTAQGTHSLIVTAAGTYAATVTASGTHDLIVEAEGAL